MADRNGRRVSIGGVIAGGFLLGAGAFGLFRGMNAQPIPEPSPLRSAADGLPAVALPAPSMPVVAPTATAPAPVGLPEPAKFPPPAAELPAVPPVSPTASVPLPAPVLPAAVAAPLPTPPAPAKSPFDSLPLPSPNLDATTTPAALPPPAALPAPADVKPVESVSTAIKPLEPALPIALPTATAPPARPDFNLRPDSPGLNVNSKEPGLPALPKPGTEVLAIPAPKPLIEQTSIPAPPSSAPGDAPMPIPFKQMVLSAAVGAALASTPAPVGAADDPKPPVKTVEDQIKEMRADIKLLQQQKEALELALNGRTDGKGTTPTEVGVLKRLELAEGDVKKLNQTIKDLETKLATKTVSEKTPITAGKGKVVLVNEFRTKLSIMVNGISYPLEPSQIRDLFLDPGEFNYELVEFPNSSVVKSTIKDGETVTLRIK